MRIVGVKEMMWIAIVLSLAIGIFFFDKLNLDWMLLIYGLGVILVGVAVYLGDWEPDFLIKDKEKKLGASYWGVYQGSALHEKGEQQTVVPPKPCKELDVVVGSGMYSKGSPVKSAK